MRDDDDIQAEQHERYYKALCMEYEVLKKEQDRRMATRDTIPYWTIGVVLLLAGAAVKNPAALLAIAPVCAILGWIRIGNDHKVTQIRWHIVARIDPSLAVYCGRPGLPVLSWETAHRENRKVTERVVAVAIEMLLFVAPGAAALWVLNTPAHVSAGVLVAASVDLVIAAVMVWQIIEHADFDRRTGTTLAQLADD